VIAEDKSAVQEKCVLEGSDEFRPLRCGVGDRGIVVAQQEIIVDVSPGSGRGRSSIRSSIAEKRSAPMRSEPDFGRRLPTIDPARYGGSKAGPVDRLERGSSFAPFP
jgi:hypothetical protein